MPRKQQRRGSRRASAVSHPPTGAVRTLRPRAIPHVLCVDDDRDSLDMLSALLEFAGYRVTCSGDANEALAQLRRQPFDVVITDYMMPGQEGRGLIRQAHDENLLGGAAVVLFTAHPSVQMEDALVVRKPADFDKFIAQIGEAVASQAAKPGAVQPSSVSSRKRVGAASRKGD